MTGEIACALTDLLERYAAAEVMRKEDGYLGDSMRDRLERAEHAFLESIKEYIDDRIEAATGARP